MADAGHDKASAVRPAGREASLFNENIFRELRAYAQVPDEFINTGWDLDKLKAGGGKGGTLMARVGSEYIVKELSEGDHKSLLQIAGSYGHHVRSGDTLLCPIYLHFQDIASGKKFFVMRNAVGDGPFKALYDLKGCADDKTIELEGTPVKAVHKRIWNVGMWCGRGSWTEERRRYFEGKQAAKDLSITMTGDQKAKFLQSLKRDTEWLAARRLMDYSLLVALKESSAGKESANGGRGPSALGHRPMIQRGPDGAEVSLCVSIIDILQKWTLGKRVARCLKVAEQNKATVPPQLYARRFYEHFAANAHEVPGGGAESPASPPRVAPSAGDPGAEGGPEERLNSRSMTAL